MTDSNTNTNLDRPAYLVKAKSLHDLLADLRKAEAWLLLAALAAFLASAFFVMKYYVGGEMTPLAWTGEQWANAILGLGITAVITAAQAFLYASGYKGPAAVMATFIVVFFGLFSEVSQSMEREDATVRQRSASSPVFQAALGSIQNLSAQAATPASSGALSSASGKVARHEAELAACRGKYRSASRVQQCEQYEYGKIAEAKGELAAAEAAANGSAVVMGSALTAAISQAKTLEYDEDKHYAMIRLLKGLFNIGGIWASFLFSMIIIGTFEYAFHFVGGYVADHKRALLLMGRDTRGELIHPEAGKPAMAAGTATISRDVGKAEERLDQVVPERAVTDASNMRLSMKGADGATFANVSAASSPVNVQAVEMQQDSRPEPPPSGVRDLTRERFFKLIYLEVRPRILNGELKPTVRPVTEAVTDVIRSHTQTLGLQPSLIGKPERQKIAETILEKLEQEAVLELNPDSGVGKSKYLLASRWVNRPPSEIPPPSQAVR
ncbi:hypothetical protein VSS37_20820 [Candidatus Thiothrix sp. Deng01]|uniref:Uncharacterized protein n=1 Tax=Candidatus Thiothrix phosphatis TaxID=3112415 RepID=A0ABU6D562_9GAMM|nr:hypothetical protein [Candidatus Thiothrix sp. Deng01]MEB4593433.1 hypothetical protein [Candidatus Thiothrix sp. Deng01]